ncbi:DUF4350 domain-containing protein [Novosphingobium sp. KACC 22771]|uniref:DUF4350 domain-containing protein n=1 Tax=Novosphingobium sp. KACC 22771 TaxID=3025670 RepID=UPI0023650D24|nr:DUF4350 domain-containing protein [Novosphingobium sp. KACC 22771]WDF72459.1 DUF4350 domain-containing protein [Novosphingobium sp. KACC 22771]
MTERSPFSPLSALALVLAGGALLVAMLWMIGAGVASGDINDGGAHGGGRGLNGYGALYRLLEATGHSPDYARDDNGLRQPGLLILTPTHWAQGDELNRIVALHRPHGPVLVILPKWAAAPASTEQPGVQEGWVRLGEARTPEWEGFLDDVGVGIAPAAAPVSDIRGMRAALPYPAKTMAGTGRRLRPAITDAGGRILAARYDQQNLALIFEPDLANNAGFAREENAAITLRLIEDLLPAGQGAVTFDLTLNGLGREPNLLTLAFTPPYLAVTLALILAGVAVLWRAYARFGPPLAPVRDIAFGKRALAENSAGLIRRARRFHLLPAPYADAARGRIAAALGLGPHGDPAMIDDAIERALLARTLAARAPEHSYTAASAALRAARRPTEILRAARQLHAIEGILTR